MLVPEVVLVLRFIVVLGVELPKKNNEWKVTVRLIKYVLRTPCNWSGASMAEEVMQLRNVSSLRPETWKSEMHILVRYIKQDFLAVKLEHL